MANPLEQRDIGPSGLSPGTHLALESLFASKGFPVMDPNKELNNVNPDDYSFHVWNIYTIVRNMLRSYLYKNKEELIILPGFIQELAKEVKLIASIYSNCKCKPQLFFPDYTKVYKGINLGKPTAETAIYREHVLMQGVLKKMNINSFNKKGTYFIPKLKGDILLTTNISVDLFNSGSISLLESHTGKLKSRYEYNSKYHAIGKNDLSMLPFTEELLYILGDKTIVVPMELKLRKEVLEIALKHKWNPRTTRVQVVSDLSRYNNFKGLLKKFKKLY